MGFTKLDAGIVLSSIATESSDTFKVWIFLLALCGPDGLVRVSAAALPGICHLPMKIVLASIKKLSGPDRHSRSGEEGGRRIKRVEGGYLIVNYLKYREHTYSQDAAAVRQRKHRAKIRDGHVTFVTSRDVSASASASASSSLRGKGRSKGDDGEGNSRPPVDPDDAALDKALLEAKEEETKLEAELERKRREGGGRRGMSGAGKDMS
jgi:hypothetical protein